jgi:hypothetical protein
VKIVLHAEETSNGALAQVVHVMALSVWCWNKQNNYYSEGSDLAHKAFCGSKDGNSKATDEKYLEFVLEKCENGILITREYKCLIYIVYLLRLSITAFPYCH